MSQVSSTFITSPPVSSPSWLRVWLRAITKPSVATFGNFANDPKATIGRAYKWVFSSTLVATGLNLLFASLGIGSVMLGGGAPLFYIPLGSIFNAVVVLIVFIISTAITHWIASTVGGAGTYKKLAFTTAAHAAPAVLILYLLAPFNEYLPWLFGIYIIVLGVITIKAVYRFGWAKTIVTYVVSVVSMAVVFLAPILVLYLFLSV